jgi:hypothetical protein
VLNPSYGLYAGVGAGNQQFDDYSIFKFFPDYAKAQKGARTIIRNQIKKAIRSGKAPGGKSLANLGKALDKL